MFVVTGASGFVGGAVRCRLDARGLGGLAVARRPLASCGGVPALCITGYADLRPPADDAVLLHLAETSDAAALDNADARAAAATLDTLLAAPWRFVVYASSALIYGDASCHPRRPDEAVLPQTLYANTKRAQEDRVLARGGAVARIANVYGRRPAGRTVVEDVLAQIPGRGPVRVRDSAPVRDFVWIDDAADGLIDIARAGVSGVFNIGSGRGTAVSELIGTALTIAGETDRPITATQPAGRTSHLVLDVSETEAVCGWRAQTALEDGLRRMMADR